MGTGLEAAIIPMLFAGGGSLVNAYAQNRAMSKQDAALAERIRAQGRYQSEADAKVRELVDQMRQSGPEDEERSILAGFQNQLRMNEANATGGLAAPSGTSAAFKDSAMKAALGIGDYGKQYAGTVAKLEAPGRQRAGENRLAGRFSSEIGQIGRFAEGEDFIQKLRADRIRANPWLMALGQAMQGYGSAGGTLGIGGGDLADVGIFGKNLSKGGF